MNFSKIIKLSYSIILIAAVVGFSFDNLKLKKETNNINPQSQNPWIAPKSADKEKNPLKGNASAVKEGKKLFTTYCVACHGDKGDGNGAAAAALNPKPKDLTSKEVQKQSDGAIFWKITTGNPPMLSFKTTLTDKQRWELVNYIREIKKKE